MGTEMRLTFENGLTTVSQELSQDADIHEVVEAVEYALRGIGFDPEVIQRGFRAYVLEETDGGAG